MLKILILNSNIDPTPYFPGLDIAVTYKNVTFKPPLRWTGIMTTGVDGWTPNVLEDVRTIVKPLEYHFIYYCYNPADYPQNQTTGGFSEAETVYIGTYLCTVRNDGNEQHYGLHETKHLACRKLYSLGYPTVDLMDSTPVFRDGKTTWIPYYKEQFPEDPESNHARTWATIEPYKQHLVDFPPVMKFGMKNPWIKYLQYDLSMNGFPCTQDGDFGHKTESQLKAFQEKKQITVDGIAYKQTFEALKKKS